VADWSDAIAAAEVLRDAAAEINRDLAGSTPNDATLSEVARLHIIVSEANGLLADVVGKASEIAGVLMEADDVDVPNVGHVHRGWQKNRTAWDSDRLRRDVVNSIRASVEPNAVDPETGELVHSWEQVLRELNRAYYLSGSNVRIKWMQAFGLEPGDYCAESKWRSKITITKEQTDDHDEEG
jgi:hypothetical protein